MKKILVATDLSSRADRAILKALKLAKEFKAHLTILHVVDEDTPKSLLEETKKIAKQEINLCIKGKATGVKHDIKIIVGTAHVDILKAISEENCDLVVLGLHRHIESSQPLVGKVIERVVKNSMKPVLVVKNRAEIDYKKILVGVDFNIHSKKSLKLAFKLFETCKFHLIHSYFMPLTASTSSLEEQVKGSCVEELDGMIKEVVSSISPKPAKPYNITKKIIKGSILDILQEEITFLKPELLVLGTHGRTGFARVLSLNVTDDFLANPSCDVLVSM